MRDRSTLFISARVVAAIFIDMSAAYLFLIVASPSILELLNRAMLCIMYALASIMLERDEFMNDINTFITKTEVASALILITFAILFAVFRKQLHRK